MLEPHGMPDLVQDRGDVVGDVVAVIEHGEPVPIGDPAAIGPDLVAAFAHGAAGQVDHAEVHVRIGLAGDFLEVDVEKGLDRYHRVADGLLFGCGIGAPPGIAASGRQVGGL